MNKIFSIGLSILLAQPIVGFATKVEAAGANIIAGGDFEGFIEEGEDRLNFTDPAFASGVKEGYGSGSWDSYVVAVKDPLKENNTVAKFSYTVEGKAWSSFFKFATIKAGTTYTIDFDYLVEGTTDNFGMRFAGSPVLENTFYSGNSTNEWKHANFEFKTDEDGSYDSIAFWFNTNSSLENKGYVDNIVIVEKETSVDPNIISGGNFEGFIEDGEDRLNFTDPAFASGVKEGYGSGSWDSYVVAVKDPLKENNTVAKFSYTVEGKAWSSFFKFATIKAGTTYTIDFDYLVEGTTDNFGMRFAGSPVLENTFYSGNSTNEWKHANFEFKTDEDGSYDSIAFWFNTNSSLENKGYVDNIVIVEKETSVDPVDPVIDCPIDYSKTYYQSKSKTVNGDFEKFEVNTILSENQLEGAWGSVSLDNPATIESVDGSKALALKKGEKQYTSAFLMLPDDLEEGQILRFTYDIKLVLKNEAKSYTAVNSSLVGGSNIEYYTVDYRLFDFSSNENRTSGAESYHYKVNVTAKENGWYNISFDYKLTRKDLIQTNSIRWLLTATDTEDKMYIDNVNLYELSETPYEEKVEVESLTITEGSSITIEKGQTKKINVVINPTDAKTTLTYKSSNDKVATVDEFGNIKAVAKGACSITVTSDNNVSAEIAIIVNEAKEEDEKPNKKGCKGSVSFGFGGFLLIVACELVLRRKKED